MEKESRLKKLRESKEITLEELGKATGFAISTLSNWEIDITMITVKNAIVLAKYFDVSIDYLVGLSDDKNTNTIIKKIIDKIRSDEFLDSLLKQPNK